MGKTRALFKRLPREFHAKNGIIKDINNKNLIEAGEIKKRWKEYTEEVYKNLLNDLDNHDDEATYIEPDILEYEVR